MAKRRNGEGSWGKKTIKGYQYYYFRDVNGSYTYGKTQKEVKEKLAKKKTNLVVNNKTTFGEYALDWLELKKKTISGDTYITYENTIKKQVLDFKNYDLSNKQIANLNAKQVQSYLNALSEVYAKATVQRAWAVVKQCIKYGEINNEIPENIIKLVALPKVYAVSAREQDFLTIEQAEQLCNVVNFKYKNGRYKYKDNNFTYIVIFLLYTGLRFGEMAALKWKNVDLENNIIHVRETGSRAKGKEGQPKIVIIDKEPKSKSGIRDIPLPQKALEALDYFNKKYPNHKDCDYVFLTNTNVGIYEHNYLNNFIKNMARDAGIKENLSAHKLRHSYCYMLLINGVNPKVVQKLMGHADISITYNIYMGIKEEDKFNAVRNVFDS